MTRLPLPQALAHKGDRALRQLDLPDLSEPLRADATWVFALSDFAAAAALRQSDWLELVLADHAFSRPATAADVARSLDEALAGVTELVGLQSALRRVRQRQQLWLVWRHLLSQASLEETTTVCSMLADQLIDCAYRHVYAWACERRGTPWGAASDTQQELVVLALGKLGGGELNLSSDVDLIFVYPEAGTTRKPGDGEGQAAGRGSGAAAETNQQFFVRLGQDLIKALDPVTADGFVFRVDMRLRPYGASGPLALDFQQIEGYYANEGRDWERYALMKARPCAGDLAAGGQLLDRLRPFVYRRYLDFGAIDALRIMKQRLLAERHLVEDIKLGGGGIRDIEFAVQMMQMIWGGREISLQQSGLLAVIDALVALGRLQAAEAAQLADAYRFLRDTEHSIQAEADRQTQQLPAAEESRQRLALSRGFADWDGFLAVLESHRASVTRLFELLVGTESAADSATAEVWLEPTEAGLAALGFDAPAAGVDHLRGLAAARDRPSVSVEGRARLDRLMPVLLETVSECAHPDLALERALPVLKAVMRRSAYLALLAENARALQRFIDVVTQSLWLAGNLAQHPMFFDTLLDERGLREVPTAADLAAQLEARLAGAADFEARLDVLREFKSHHVFDVALAEVRGALPLMRVSDALTFLAEAILEAALRLAWDETVERFPAFADNRAFVVIGYGKLGGLELGPGSDLDLVFVHDLGENSGQFLHRLVRRLLSILTAPTYHGALYEIDTRLRPSGNAGTMVSSLEAFLAYQADRAWVWEHQALVRARPVAGDAELGARFQQTRRELLCQPRDHQQLREEVLKMRRRISEHQPDDEDLKRGSGGIVDIEFVVQYLVLAWAHRHPSLTDYTDNVRILETAERLELLPALIAQRLRDAYLGLRAEGHRAVLDLPDQARAAEVLAEYRSDVRQAWQLVFEND